MAASWQQIFCRQRSKTCDRKKAIQECQEPLSSNCACQWTFQPYRNLWYPWTALYMTQLLELKKNSFHQQRECCRTRRNCSGCTMTKPCSRKGQRGAAPSVWNSLPKTHSHLSNHLTSSSYPCVCVCVWARVWKFVLTELVFLAL